MVAALPVMNGSTETDMPAETETWELKEESGGAGGGSEQENMALGVGGQEKADDEMMEEEEEEMPTPKVASVLPDAPKKEHVNVVFIGHVGESHFSACQIFICLSESTKHHVSILFF